MSIQRNAILTAATLAVVAVFGLAAGAARGATTDSPQATFKQECGACHWAYLPALLPARSWRAITSDLSHHFRQNASLDPATTRRITGYLVSHAGDAPGSNRAFLRHVRASETPLRITDLPVWRAIHEEIRASVFSRPDIKTKANCLGCHRN